MVLIRGNSGTGKSSIVHELQTPVLRHKYSMQPIQFCLVSVANPKIFLSSAHFLSVKFDQFQRSTSFLVLAFRDLIRRILTKGTS